ncbi:MAG: hypothetical protein WCJ35_11655 [Planctomycetota bacterium]
MRYVDESGTRNLSAQVISGHAKAAVTQVYAERDMALAAEVMGKIG